ncbi:MAG TPA: preprotein translocase subunit SecY, partial [Candidatus Methanofastidiosa archaeon]|nr:preprotein translocase subunit SecY [Candidatus Methanofastidiosa archaeon]
MSLQGALTPLFRILPEVTSPTRHISLKERLIWSGVILTLYFVLSEIPLCGLPSAIQDMYAGFRTVLAGNSGSLLHLGIGPIVTAGIIMQLLQGSDILGMDLSTHQGKATFQGTQKVLAIFLCVFEAFIFAFAWRASVTTGVLLFLIAQMAVGALLLLMMDEVVTKWGFGSGVSLFIAARVSGQVFWQAFSPLKDESGQFLGAIPDFISKIINGETVDIFTRTYPYPDMLSLFFTIVVFLIVVYFETMRIEIPLSYGKYKGIRGRYPIKFIYASNIPMILTVALFANVRILAQVTNFNLIGAFDSDGNITGGLLYYLTSPSSLSSLSSDPIRGLVYLVIVVFSCILFAKLWIELTNMGPKAVAKRLQSSGMQIPGFRKDIRILEKILSRYIPQVTVMGGAFVGLIAVLAD